MSDIDKREKLPPALEKEFDEFEATLKKIAKLPKAEREKFADMMRDVLAKPRNRV